MKPNKRIDTSRSPRRCSTAAGTQSQVTIKPLSLPQRNLLRSLTWSLPSGQAVAKAVGATPTAADDLAELKPYGFQSSTPLFYYVLKEAEQVADGLHLGPVGGRARRSGDPSTWAAPDFRSLRIRWASKCKESVAQADRQHYRGAWRSGI